MDFLKSAMYIFAEVISKSKPEAFLHGYLMGLGHGGHQPDLKLIEADPSMFIPIEKDMLRISKKVRDQAIEEACFLLSSIYILRGDELPRWLKERVG